MTSTKPHEQLSAASLLDERRQRRGRHRPTPNDQLLDALRAQPFEDLGFARVDHHRSIRQGFPEVVLGLGKTPAQIAAIAAEIVARGSTLLVTRASAGGVRRGARRGARRDVLRRGGASSPFASRTSPRARARSSSRRPARPTCRSPRKRRGTAELMGNDVDRLYDVGVAGLHRLLGERARLDGRPRHHRRRRHGRRAAERRRRPGQRAGHRRADQRSATAPASAASPRCSAC